MASTQPPASAVSVNPQALDASSGLSFVAGSLWDVRKQNDLTVMSSILGTGEWTGGEFTVNGYLDLAQSQGDVLATITGEGIETDIDVQSYAWVGVTNSVPQSEPLEIEFIAHGSVRPF